MNCPLSSIFEIHVPSQREFQPLKLKLWAAGHAGRPESAKWFLLVTRTQTAEAARVAQTEAAAVCVDERAEGGQPVKLAGAERRRDERGLRDRIRTRSNGRPSGAWGAARHGN